MRWSKAIGITLGLAWIARQESRLRRTQSEVEYSRQEIARQISEHRDHSPHGIALIGSAPPLDFEPPMLAGGQLNGHFNYGLPVFDPHNIVTVTTPGA